MSKPEYGPRSRRVLATLHPDLQKVFTTVLGLGYDHSLIEGHRSEEDQNFFYDQGKSKVKFPNSKHNSLPSLAVDAMPWFKTLPHIDWRHSPSIYHFAGVVKGVAAMLYHMGEIKHLRFRIKQIMMIASRPLQHLQIPLAQRRVRRADPALDHVSRVERLERIAREVYGADGVSYSDTARQKLSALQRASDVSRLGP